MHMNVQNMFLMFHSLVCSWTVQLYSSYEEVATALMLGYCGVFIEMYVYIYKAN